MTIGERIKEARKYRNMTQKQLADAAEVATGTIQQYELGKREPRYEILVRLASALNFSVSALCNSEPYSIRDLAPEVISDEINKSRYFDMYLSSLGFQVFEDSGLGSLGYDFLEEYSYDGQNDHTLIVDHNRGKLYLLDSAQYEYAIQHSVETYTKFFIDDLIAKGIEVYDDGTGGWLKADPRKGQQEEFRNSIGKPKATEKPPQD
ncbi:MAG: helix-turn-helix transcriptional regulator [Ruminococcaceae bacterium]|nr:helix-turn-helix transcriptional regulator [Oscillospiraceae bacterium]MBE6984889.1 helix-turn-helix transcriptional regulator [Oscillospiraceae bacterium]